MSITLTHLYTSRSNVDQTAYTTPSNLSPSANKLVIGVTHSQHASVTPNIPTVSGGGVSAWATYQDYIRNTVRRLSVVYGLSGSSPGSAQLQFDFDGQTQTNLEWSFFEVDGVPLTNGGLDAFVQSNEGQTGVNQTSYSLTLSSPFFGPGSIAVGAYAIAASRTAAAQAPATTLGMINGINENATLVTIYEDQLDPVAEFTGTAAGWYGIVFELQALSDIVTPIVQRSAYATKSFNGRLR